MADKHDTKNYKLKCSGKDIDNAIKILKKIDIAEMSKKIAEIEKKIAELE